MLFSLIMVLATISTIVRFTLNIDRFVAARVSNALVLLTLFAVGFGSARLIHANPWVPGWSTVLFGLAMVVIVVLLGGQYASGRRQLENR